MLCVLKQREKDLIEKWLINPSNKKGLLDHIYVKIIWRFISVKDLDFIHSSSVSLQKVLSLTFYCPLILNAHFVLIITTINLFGVFCFLSYNCLMRLCVVHFIWEKFTLFNFVLFVINQCVINRDCSSRTDINQNYCN